MRIIPIYCQEDNYSALAGSQALQDGPSSSVLVSLGDKLAPQFRSRDS